MSFRHILVANRGEIALRVMRTAHALGYRTTSIYSDADAGSPHVAAADVAVRVGPAAAVDSYLHIERVLAAARATGADAIHPGYGFLSERAEFSQACRDAGITFIGPGPEVIAAMGDKRAARRRVASFGVESIPGYDGDDQSDERLIEQAHRIGVPLMVKAAAGGGGKGMRRVDDAAGLADTLIRVRAEARASFGDGSLILEKCIASGRHVEVQVVADGHGHALHLGERDCSTQRRFQKLIEEAPSPAVSSQLRERMGQAAVAVARGAGYLGVGTVEFLLDDADAFYFLEMNTRLQVEHAVTERITGLDLVALQFQIAQGEPLPFSQAEVTFGGHAIEARLYAENPAADFLPQTGCVARFCAPDGDGVRVDHALREGLDVSAHYDPMLAKIIAHGADRAEAVRRLRRALEDTVLLGVQTNRDFLLRVLGDATFASGQMRTDFLAGSPAALTDAASARPSDLAAAAVAHVLRASHGQHADALAGWTNGTPLGWPVSLECEGTRHELQVSCVRPPDGFEVRGVDRGAHVAVERARLDADSLHIRCGGQQSGLPLAWVGDTLWLQTQTGVLRTVDRTFEPAGAADEVGDHVIVAPMEGIVVEVRARIGQEVARHEPLLVLEAMKLQHVVLAPVAGRVAGLFVEARQHVTLRQKLAEIEPLG